MSRMIHYGVAVIVEDAAGRVLMQHRDNNPKIAFPDTWSVPTGGIVAEDKPVTWQLAIDNALRELREEIGLDPGRDGFRRVVCERRYQAAVETRAMFEAGGVELEVVEDEVQAYPE